jgi:mutator protein MutT
MEEDRGMVPGRDYIGVGVGAMVFDGEGRVFLARRGPRATNERGAWEFPGGKVDFGETLATAICREFLEEYGMRIEVVALLGVPDHILPDEGQHWISPTFIARHVGGEPVICEPAKCAAIGWFTLDALPTPLSQVSRQDVALYRERYGTSSEWRVVSGE